MSKKEREHTIEILSTKLSKQNAESFEKLIYTMFEKNKKIGYSNIAYEKIGEIFSAKTKEDKQQIIQDIKQSKMGYESSAYKNIKNEIDIENDRVINPPVVKKGVYKCKCGSRKTWSYQLQTRSMDEPMTNFINCIDCGREWREG